MHCLCFEQISQRHSTKIPNCFIIVFKKLVWRKKKVPIKNAFGQFGRQTMQLCEKINVILTNGKIHTAPKGKISVPSANKPIRHICSTAL